MTADGSTADFHQCGKSIFALTVDPGGLVDSRAFNGQDVPPQWSRKIHIVNFLQPLLKFVNPTIRRTADAARDIVDLAVGPRGAGQSGYFIMSDKAESSKASQDEVMQLKVWEHSIKWAGIEQENTVVTL